jgi:hypothetical protein
MLIGLFLGISYEQIQIFKLESTQLMDWVSKIVDAWLSQRYDVIVFGEPTWRKLVEAIGSRSGGHHQCLATEIARDHPLCHTGEA